MHVMISVQSFKESYLLLITIYRSLDLHVKCDKQFISCHICHLYYNYVMQVIIYILTIILQHFLAGLWGYI